ncbi:hypothetical protein PF002_g5238 [Phytophthora fragariae]|uniref:Uncharacterized protein n=1 Tax=Phytophthora fragariae TaxID=53985 RepID=A0A6A4A5B8_9STRA|nr:hypothetical protein PF003_g4902 [Phytophthora fragariae]KAE9249551.1 hypothetical protein PF002_g5238 [Phytophthora fragariae]
MCLPNEISVFAMEPCVHTYAQFAEKFAVLTPIGLCPDQGGRLWGPQQRKARRV